MKGNTDVECRMNWGIRLRRREAFKHKEKNKLDSFLGWACLGERKIQRHLNERSFKHLRQEMTMIKGSN